MFWDNVSGVYDLFITLKNGRVNKKLCRAVADMIEPSDTVLECACGTGMISVFIAEKCRSLTATDFSGGMLRQARKKCRRFSNVTVEQADITKLRFADSSFDRVAAANVIHLLDDPDAALRELQRVCRPGGTVIIPTYINNENNGKPGIFVKTVGKMGAGFRNQFTYRSYRDFFLSRGLQCSFEMIPGSMPCAIAVITCRK